MNKNIIKTIRFGAVLGLALFAFTGEVFAAPTLTPVQVNNITKTTATLIAKVESPYKTSTVWFEWSESSSLSPMTTVGLTSIYNGGFFQALLSGLKSDTTYYYRAVAMEGGTTLYSQPASFKTAGVEGAAATTVLYQNTTPTPTTAPVVVAPVVTQTTSVSSTQTKKYTAPVVIKKPTIKVVAKEGFTNGNSNTAAVVGAGDGILPGTLIGWIALLILVLVVVILILMISETSEKRKKARLAKKLAEEEKENETDKILEGSR